MSDPQGPSLACAQLCASAVVAGGALGQLAYRSSHAVAATSAAVGLLQPQIRRLPRMSHSSQGHRKRIDTVRQLYGPFAGLTRVHLGVSVQLGWALAVFVEILRRVLRRFMEAAAHVVDASPVCTP